jgi:RNA polymerase sporulation-specific sigma factor
MKTCKFCGKELVQKRRPSWTESTNAFRKRITCGMDCRNGLFGLEKAERNKSQWSHLISEGQLSSDQENALVAQWLPLVKRVCREVSKIKAQVENDDSWLQVGAIGLLKAVRTFRTNGGAKFQTYAFTCILTELLKELQHQSRLKRTGLRQWSYDQAITPTYDGGEATPWGEDKFVSEDKGPVALEAESLLNLAAAAERPFLKLHFEVGNVKAAQVLGVSRQRVEQRVKAGLERIRRAVG